MKSAACLTIITTLCIRCGSATPPAPAAHIEGVYANQAEGEFSKAFDTVTVSAFDPKAAIYIIAHKTGYFRISKGVMQPKQYKAENSIGVFDEQHLQLQEQKKGIVYSFTSSGDELLVGAARYRKIK